MAEKSLAQSLAAYSTSLNYDALPASTIHEVKRRLIDSVGCALGAFHAAPVSIARRLAATVSGDSLCGVIGGAFSTTPEWAAFANGVAIRYFDFNDTYLSLEPAHPSDNFAAVLAAVQLAKGGGKELILGTALAYEVQCRLCDACSIRARGWDHVTYGAFSGTLGAARAMGLSEAHMVHAIGIAGTTNNALRQTRVGELSMWKGCAFANASRNAVFSALLAREGMTGPAPLFEGAMGFWKQVSGLFELNLGDFGGGGNAFMIERTYIKFWPAEYHAQSAIDAALQLRAEILEATGRSPSSPRRDELAEEIVEIEIATFDAAADIIGDKEKWRPQSRETADHSLPYCAAVALIDGEVTQEQFEEERYLDEVLLGLVGRVRLIRDDSLTAGYPEGIPNRLTIRMRSGDEFRREVRYPRGHAGNPMTDEEVEHKFRILAEPMVGPRRAQEALDFMWSLEDQGGLEPLFHLLEVQPALI